MHFGLASRRDRSESTSGGTQGSKFGVGAFSRWRHGQQHFPHPHDTKQSPSGGWTTSASGSTVVDSCSGFSGAEAPGSPAEVAARHAAGAVAAAAGGGISSSSSGGGESSGGSSNSGQHQSRQQQQQQQAKQEGNFKGRIPKFKLTTGRSSTSDTPSETERKRKAHDVALRDVGSVMHGQMNHSRQPGNGHGHGHGRVIDGRFEVLETLGTGYSGKVKRAINYQTGEAVALKIMNKLDPNDINSERRQIRLLQEVEAMKRCANHPHIVSLKEARYDVVYPKKNNKALVGAHMLVLELCERGELFDLLYRGGPVSPVVCQEYFRQLMSGIKFCHDQGVCHRDLKPENLLLDADFTLKIADFGFAASGLRGTMCHSIVGSRTYMAPEVISPQVDDYGREVGYDPTKADVWSAGIILFTMLAGHPPMEKATTSDWWFRALSLHRQDLFWQSHENTAPTFPEMAKKLISAMLIVDPSNRINVDQIMAHPYLAVPPSPKQRGFSLKGRPASIVDPRTELRKEMQARYDASMASKRLCTVASSSRGTADSAGAEVSAPESTAAASSVASSGFVPRPYDQDVLRCPGDSGFEVPTMTQEEAEQVTGGFRAIGGVRNLVKALARALQAMGAEIDGVKQDGTREIQETSKVSAVIKGDPKVDTPVGIVAKVFRVVSGQSGQGSAVDDAPLMVVLRRKRGDYHRYCKVEASLVKRMTVPTVWLDKTAAVTQSVSMSPTP